MGEVREQNSVGRNLPTSRSDTLTFRLKLGGMAALTERWTPKQMAGAVVCKLGFTTTRSSHGSRPLSHVGGVAVA